MQVYRSILCHRKLLAAKNRAVHVNQVFQHYQDPEESAPRGEPIRELENFLQGHAAIEGRVMALNCERVGFV